MPANDAIQTKVYAVDGSEKGTVVLPKVFSTLHRPDLIQRVFLAQFSHRVQPSGTDPMAGERTSAASFGTGRGMARVARVRGERHPRAGVAAGVASVVKGRVAHPPKSAKVIWKRVNAKERRLAIASAIAATANHGLVSERGHRIEKIASLPLVVSNSVESISKTGELRSMLQRLSLDDDVRRTSRSRRRLSGKPRMRGRVSKVGRGPLFVVAKDRGLGRAARNLPGVECALAKDVNTLQLAPGGRGGRLVVWSEGALKALPGTILEIGERFAT